ncbi:flagellar protein [Helicobacter cetorum]|uniref:flagellar protein n=1 Tax=Helicobacter cetorum TaxID=138563 RepID=UPI000CF1ABCD|nr:flagellar protein [Helicobacter cetorum]
MKKQVLTGALIAVLATGFAYADDHKGHEGKKPKLSTELVVAKDEKGAKKPKLSTELVAKAKSKKAKKAKFSVEFVAHKDDKKGKDTKKSKNSVA